MVGLLPTSFKHTYECKMYTKIVDFFAYMVLMIIGLCVLLKKIIVALYDLIVGLCKNIMEIFSEFVFNVLVKIFKIIFNIKK